MNCNEVRTSLSAWVDGELGDVEARSFDVHVAACEACEQAARSLGQSVDKLRSLRVRPLDPGAVAAIVTAATDPEPSARPLLTPVRQSSAAPPGRAAAGAWRKPVTWISHLAALLLGLLLTSLGRDDAGAAHPETGPPPATPSIAAANGPDPEPVVITRLVEVEVPVERVVERVVEVEVPVEVVRYVDRPVPLIQDASLAALRDSGAAAWAALASAAADGLHMARLTLEHDSMQRPTPSTPSAPSAALDALDARRDLAPPRRPRAVVASASREPVVFTRDGALVGIRTRGTDQEVVPALISALSNPDESIAAAAEQHLSTLRARIAPGSSDPRRETGELEGAENRATGGVLGYLGSRQRGDIEPITRSERWERWWSAHRGGVSAVASL